MAYKQIIEEIKIGVEPGSNIGFATQQDAQDYADNLSEIYNDEYTIGKYDAEVCGVPMILWDQLVVFWFIISTVIFMIECDPDDEDCDEEKIA